MLNAAEIVVNAPTGQEIALNVSHAITQSAVLHDINTNISFANIPAAMCFS